MNGDFNPPAFSIAGMPLEQQPANGLNADIDRLAAVGALSENENRDKLIDEKAGELAAIAEAKRIEAEAVRQAAEAKKKHEGVKQSAGILDAESAELEKKAAKAKAFFTANRAVLNIIGIREPLGYRTMSAFYFVALPLYLIFCIAISFPIAVIEFLVGIVIETAGKISKKVTTTFLRITTGVCSIGLTGGVVVGIWILVRCLLL